METIGFLKIIIFFATVAIPLIFQLLFGSGIIPIGRKMPFWLVCVISVLLWFGTYYLGAQMISYQLKKINSHDGMPFVALLMIESCIAVFTVLTILIQLILKYKKRKRDA